MRRKNSLISRLEAAEQATASPVTAGLLPVVLEDDATEAEVAAHRRQGLDAYRWSDPRLWDRLV